MILFKWNSELPFRDVKAKIKEIKKAAPEKPAHKWSFLRLWRFLLIHYVGPAYLDDHGGRETPEMPHMLILGFLLSRAGKTKFIGLYLFDYVKYLLFPLVFFSSVFYGSGSWVIAALFALIILLMIVHGSQEPARELLLGIKLYLGFDLNNVGR